MSSELQIPYTVCALLLEFAKKQKTAAGSEATNQTEPATAQDAPHNKGTSNSFYHSLTSGLNRPGDLPNDTPPEELMANKPD